MVAQAFNSAPGDRQISLLLRPAWSTYIAPSQPTTLSQGWGSAEPADLLRLYILEFQFKARSTVPVSDFCSVNTAKPVFRVLPKTLYVVDKQATSLQTPALPLVKCA